MPEAPEVILARLEGKLDGYHQLTEHRLSKMEDSQADQWTLLRKLKGRVDNQSGRSSGRASLVSLVVSLAAVTAAIIALFIK